MAKDKSENLAKDQILAKRAYEFVKELKGDLEKKRKPLENMWADCLNAFKVQESKTWFKSDYPYCASDLRDAVMNIVPRLSKAVWYTDVPFELVPVGEEGDDDQLAEINQKVLAWDFRNLQLYPKYVDAIFQKAIYGTCIVKTPPHFEELSKELKSWIAKDVYGVKMKSRMERKKETERTFMGTDFCVVDIMDFWVDPSTVKRGIKDHVEFADTIEAITVRKTDLLEGEKRDYYVNIDKIESDYIGSKPSRENSVKDRMKRSGKIRNSPSSRLEAKEHGNPYYEITETIADFDSGDGIEKHLIAIGADKECIRLQKWQWDKPYLTSRYSPNGFNKEFYGTGIIETGLSNHYERNTTRKQIISARTMGLNMEMLSDSTGFPNKPDRLRTAPNKIHFLKNINGVKPFIKPIGEILQSGITYETMLKSETQLSTGNTPYIQGAGVQAINDTATGIMQLTQSGNEKFTLPLQLDETELLEPYVKRCLQNNIDYRKEAFYIRLTDKKPIRVEPEQLSANFDVYSKGSVELQNKQQRQTGLLKYFELSTQLAQIESVMYGQPLTKFTELKKEIASNLGLSNPDQFEIDPKDLQGQKQQVLTPELEWVLLQRMNDGVAPPLPILLQPTEDFHKHYNDHVSRTNTEDFKLLKPEIQQIWFAHLNLYEKLFNWMETQKREKSAEKEIQSKEVEAGV